MDVFLEAIFSSLLLAYSQCTRCRTFNYIDEDEFSYVAVGSLKLFVKRGDSSFYVIVIPGQ